ncbi:MAG: hypothetical protein WCS77_04590 [Elusimicrobiaceae bacterium]
MNNNIPEFRIPSLEKKPEKPKKGFLPWLFGGGKTGASVGLAGSSMSGGGGFLATLLASKTALLVSLSLSAGLLALGGTYMLTSMSASSKAPSLNTFAGGASYSSNPNSNYDVRENQGRSDSLKMFAEKNAGQFGSAASVSKAGTGDAKDQVSQEDLDKAADEAMAKKSSDSAPDAVAPAKLSQLMGAAGFSDSGSGGGSGGAMPTIQNNGIASSFGGPLSGGINSNGIMASFKKPDFHSASGLGQARVARNTGGSIKRDFSSKKAIGQAKGIGASMGTARTSVDEDSSRTSIEDAWEGSRTSGSVMPVVDDGAAVGSGGSGSSGGSSSGSGTSATASTTTATTDSDDTTTPESSEGEADSPWGMIAALASILLIIANIVIIVLSILAMIRNSNPLAAIILTPITKILLIAAIVIASLVMILGIAMMAMGQMSQGLTMMLAAGLTIAAAVVAFAVGVAGALIAGVLAALSTVVCVIGAMMGGS